MSTIQHLKQFKVVVLYQEVSSSNSDFFWMSRVSLYAYANTFKSNAGQRSGNVRRIAKRHQTCHFQREIDHETVLNT